MAKTQFFRKPGKRGYRDMRTKKKPAVFMRAIANLLQNDTDDTKKNK